MINLNNHKIFLLDAVGAAVSLVLLFLLYTFDEYFGMPKSVLQSFIAVAAVFMIYSASVYILKPTSWKFYLKIIAMLNIGYCLLTAYRVYQHSNSITTLGCLYFIGEIAVILLLAFFELRIAYRPSNEIHTKKPNKTNPLS